jgi:hypothetical protein
VHCKERLSKTGTLIELYVVAGVRGDAGYGLLEMLQPGSVIGQQQHFLCPVESSPPLAAALSMRTGICQRDVRE